MQAPVSTPPGEKYRMNQQQNRGEKRHGPMKTEYLIEAKGPFDPVETRRQHRLHRQEPETDQPGAEPERVEEPAIRIRW